MKKYVALDIGNVCVDIDRSRFWNVLNLREKPEFWQIAKRLEHGLLSEKLFFEETNRLLFPDHPRSAPELRDAFNSILGKPVPGMETLFRELLSDGIGVAFFSDISTIHLSAFRDIFLQGSNDLPGTFSFEVGCWKPEPAMFSDFERKFGVPLLYTDDRSELVEAAAAHGWNSSVFTSADQIRKLLEMRYER